MTLSPLKARRDESESAQKPDSRRREFHQMSRIFITVGGWECNEVPPKEGELNPTDTLKPLDSLKGPEPSNSKDYTHSRALQNAQFLNDIDAFLSTGRHESFRVKNPCLQIDPLARFLSEGHGEQACIIALKEEVGGLNISTPPLK